jgi:uncharacterized protein YkwD
MRLSFLATASLIFSFKLALARENSSPADQEHVSAAAVVREINFARANPSLYATFVAESRPFHMIEHGRAVDEAVRFLKKERPLPPLTLSTGMSRAAADHCAEQVEGQLGHDGADRSSPGDRISRYGTWSATWGENISYGQKTARGIVLTLIIDDGVRARSHRKIFSIRSSIMRVLRLARTRDIAPCAASILRAVMPNEPRRWSRGTHKPVELGLVDRLPAPLDSAAIWCRDLVQDRLN